MCLRRLSLAAVFLSIGLWSRAALSDADPISLSWPVDCMPGDDCWIANHVDLDPGPDARDFACGPRTYDGHGGTDIAIRDLREMEAGVAVVAAAAGQVIGRRDTMPDVMADKAAEGGLAGRLCGNGLTIDHGKGWRTQYCHMKRGSLVVSLGQRVVRGQVLGEIGLSGRTEFPHLHFGVFHGDDKLDPFRGRKTAGRHCGLGPLPLWEPAVLARIPYQPLIIFNAGFATESVEGPKILAGDYRTERQPAVAPALVFWIDSLGVRRGDRLTLRLSGPEGVIAENIEEIGRSQARRWAFIGRKRRKATWPAGNYRGEAEIFRPAADGAAPVRRRITREIAVY